MQTIAPRRRFSALVLALVVFFGSAGLYVNQARAASITAMSVTHATLITNNSAAASTAIITTGVSVNFTLPNSITSSDTLQIVFGGVTVSAVAGLQAANVTVSGGCSGTATLVGGTIVQNTNDPTINLTNLTCSTSPAVVTIAASILTTRTAGNYTISINTGSDAGMFFFYIGSENQVTVTGTVNAAISFVIRDSTDAAALGNVGGGSSGPNLCALGVISSTSTASCSYRLKVTTNVTNGYVISYYSGTTGGANYRFNNGASPTPYDFTDAAETTGVDITATSAENYGVDVHAGRTTTSSSGTARSSYFGGGDGAADAKAYRITQPIGTTRTLVTSTTDNAPSSSGDTTNTVLVTHQAKTSGSTNAGNYTHTVTYLVVPSL